MKSTTIPEQAMYSACRAARLAEAVMHRSTAERFEATAEWLSDEDMSTERPKYLRRLAAAHRALADVIEEDE